MLLVDTSAWVEFFRKPSRLDLADHGVAGVGLSLIEEALEHQEDLHFSEIADERLERDEKRVPHGKAWG